MDPNFNRFTGKSNGFAPSSYFKIEEMVNLDSWMVPGLFCDMGLNIPLEEARKMVTLDSEENSLGLPAGDFTVLQINRYMMNRYRPSSSRHSSALIGGDKVNQKLGPEFYSHYSWVDPAAAILTEEEILDLLTQQNSRIIFNNLAPWGVTLFPRDAHDVKYLSVFRNSKEYVCRTKADRQTGILFYTYSSEIFNCVICND